ncbi:hypothetical protein [Krasilnikovia cinnamomea]|uniref:hypothetical protein n=1 Tax=Krasilnikovia cinnamomea TaxID=349313 RepID=UPI00102CF19F|nr:hypothetical protein [Krasilnikovia cinnamomea]
MAGIAVGHGVSMGAAAVQSASTPSGAGERWPRWRVWIIRIWYGLLGLWALSMSQGVVRLILGDAGADERFTYVVVTAWKLLALGGVLGVSWTGGRSVVAFQAVVVGFVGWWGSELLYAVHPADATPAASMIATVVLWLLPLVLLRPHRGELARFHARPSAVLLPLALVAAVPLCVYAVRQGDLATGLNGRVEVYYVSSGLGLVLAVQVVFAGFRPRGSRWLPRFVALVAVCTGLAAIVWPDDLTSPGRGWGIALVCWALLFMVGAEVEVNRDPP